MSLVIVRALGLVTIQDRGRRGRMHEGVSPGGALVRSLHAHANSLANNPLDAPAIEILGKLVVRAASQIFVATEMGARTLTIDEELTIESEPRRVAYLAVRGGASRTGSSIAAGQLAAIPTTTTLDLAPRPIRVIPGPDLDASALDGARYTISPHSDRIGTRLVGPAIARTPADERTRPMVRGAIEVPGDGQPIVLGPDHPTTGGYPLVGVIASADLDLFFATRIGGDVQFVIAGR